MPSQTLRLKSSDGDLFEVDLDIAKCSLTIKTMLEDLGFEEGDDEIVTLANISSVILRKVIVWATYHKVCLFVLVKKYDSMIKQTIFRMTLLFWKKMKAKKRGLMRLVHGMQIFSRLTKDHSLN
jgi:hypothetical protein